jgi:hypothetical protein
LGFGQPLRTNPSEWLVTRSPFELELKPSDLLAVLADHWSTVSGIKIPRSEGRSLLAFEEYVLLEPIAAACALIWSALDPPTSIKFVKTDEWHEWAPLAGRDWNEVVRIELARLGLPKDTSGDNGAELLASARAEVLKASAEPALITESIVRTSGWPGQPKLIDGLADQAVSLALEQISDCASEFDNDALVAEIQRSMTPRPEVLARWTRDPSFGTLYDYCGDASTGAEMHQEAVHWLTWSLAVEVVVALRRAPPLGG